MAHNFHDPCNREYTGPAKYRAPSEASWGGLEKRLMLTLWVSGLWVIKRLIFERLSGRRQVFRLSEMRGKGLVLCSAHGDSL
jgi:hypothetical protein